MKLAAPSALFLIAIVATTTGAIGQNVYRCGTTYSEKPCTDGVAVNVQDSRTPAQKKESDATIRHDVATAEALEKAQQKELARSNKPGSESTKTTSRTANAKPTANKGEANSADKSSKDSSSGMGHARKKKEPEYFTARTVAPKPAPKASANK